MKKKQYDLNFKKMVVAKGKEIGNMTAVARQHELDPKMVLRWARELNRKVCLAIKVVSPPSPYPIHSHPYSHKASPPLHTIYQKLPM